MAPLLCILGADASAPSDEALRKFGLFLGLPAETIPVPPDLADIPQPLAARAPGSCILAFSQAALRRLAPRPWFQTLLRQTSFTFVYGFEPSGADATELAALTEDALRAVSALPHGKNEFTIHPDAACGGFPPSQLGYELKTDSAAAFEPGPAAHRLKALISVNQRPLFVALPRDTGALFLFAGDTLVDIDTLLPQRVALRAWYPPLIAMAVALRAAGGPYCWTAPILPASFVIDDPHLKKRYGYIDYETLMPVLRDTRAALTIAFIPYNYRRSDPKTVALLRDHPDRFSIAVHGCDHTYGEFASLDETWMRDTAERALHRIEAHQAISGMPFDNVMVFPQGRFSTVGVRALKQSGYGAAVNTGAWPLDYAGNLLSIRDLLGVAVLRYETFPIFVRRYPRHPVDFAFDALFQKPILCVEHHAFFRLGYGSFAAIIGKLSALDPRISWMPLGRAVASSCVLRQTADAEYALRHFAPVLQFRNPTGRDILLHIERPQKPDPVTAVRVDGRDVPFEYTDGAIRYTVQLPAGATLSATIISPASRRRLGPTSWAYRLFASTRRLLSDFRDNHLSRSPRLLAWAEKTKNLFRR